MSLEEQVTKGSVTYIHALGYDRYRAHLIILFQHPEESAISRTIIFRGVRNYDDVWDEEELIQEYDIDSIIGIDEYVEGEEHKIRHPHRIP